MGHGAKPERKTPLRAAGRFPNGPARPYARETPRWAAQDVAGTPPLPRSFANAGQPSRIASAQSRIITCRNQPRTLRAHIAPQEAAAPDAMPGHRNPAESGLTIKTRQCRRAPRPVAINTPGACPQARPPEPDGAEPDRCRTRRMPNRMDLAPARTEEPTRRHRPVSPRTVRPMQAPPAPVPAGHALSGPPLLWPGRLQTKVPRC